MTPGHIRRIVTELEQTAVAVSVVGTSFAKLKEMATIAETVLDSLVGDRPEIARVRLLVRQLIQNVRVSGTGAQVASTALRRLANGMSRVDALVKHGLTDAQDEFDIETFSVLNVWGYSTEELGTARKSLGDVARKLRRLGMPELSSCIVQLDPRLASSFVSYLRDNDTLAMDLSRRGNDWDVYYALGARLWKGFQGKDRELWGGVAGDDRFQKVFADTMSEREKPSRDTRARLALSIGIEA